jgi:hypothetical protein
MWGEEGHEEDQHLVWECIAALIGQIGRSHPRGCDRRTKCREAGVFDPGLSVRSHDTPRW